MEKITGEMTIEKLLQTQDSVFHLCSQIIEKAGVLYRLGKIADFYMAEIRNYEKARMPLLKKYAKETEPGKWQVDPKNIEKYNTGLQTLLDQKVSYSFDPIDLTDCEVKLSAVDFSVWEMFLDKGYLQTL